MGYAAENDPWVDANSDRFFKSLTESKLRSIRKLRIRFHDEASQLYRDIRVVFASIVMQPKHGTHNIRIFTDAGHAKEDATHIGAAVKANLSLVFGAAMERQQAFKHQPDDRLGLDDESPDLLSTID